MFHVQPEDDHYQASKHVVVPDMENTLYSTNKYSCVRPVHTLYIMLDQYTQCTLVTLMFKLDRCWFLESFPKYTFLCSKTNNK